MSDKPQRRLTEEQRNNLLHGYPLFDPRDPSQALEDRSSWKRTHNPALLQALIALAAGGEVDWVHTAKLADECDKPVPVSSISESDYRQPFSMGDACITMDEEGKIVSVVLGGYKIT